MPMLVTQNIRSKDMFNMEPYNIDNIEEADHGNLNFILNGTAFSQ